MNLKYYQIFKEVAKTENFTRAAENLFITQSAVSHAMKELEEQTHIALFERLHKSVKLTKSGELLLHEISPILEDLEKLESRLSNLEAKTPIHIASCITFADIWLSHLIKDFKHNHAPVSIKVEVNSAAQALSLLADGKVDLAFIEGTLNEEQFITKTLSTYKIGFFMSPNYCQKRKLILKELLHYSLLLRERGSAVRETFESAVTLAGYQVFAEWTSVDSFALIEAAKAGLGIAVLPMILVEQEIKQGNLIEIVVTDLKVANNITMVYHKQKHMSDSLDKFKEHVVNYI